MALIRIWNSSRGWGERSQTELCITVKSVLLLITCCDLDKWVTTHCYVQVLPNMILIVCSCKMGAVMSSESLSYVG